MAVWLQYVIAATALIVLAPALAWAGRRYGRRAKSAFILAGLMLGLGEPLDPPSSHRIEADNDAVKPPGDPPTTD